MESLESLVPQIKIQSSEAIKKSNIREKVLRRYHKHLNVSKRFVFSEIGALPLKINERIRSILHILDLENRTIRNRNKRSQKERNLNPVEIPDKSE